MTISKHSNSQIIFILNQASGGVPCSIYIPLVNE